MFRPSVSVAAIARRLFLPLATGLLHVPVGAIAATEIEHVYLDRNARVLYIDGREFRSDSARSPLPYVRLGDRRLQVDSSSTTDSHIETVLPADLDLDASELTVIRMDGLSPNAEPETAAADQQPRYEAF